MPSKNCYHKIQTQNRAILIKLTKILSHLLTSSPAVSNVLNLGKLSYEFPVHSCELLSRAHWLLLCGLPSICQRLGRKFVFCFYQVLSILHPWDARSQTPPLARPHWAFSGGMEPIDTQLAKNHLLHHLLQTVGGGFVVLHTPSISDIFYLCFSNQKMLASWNRRKRPPCRLFFPFPLSSLQCGQTGFASS